MAIGLPVWLSFRRCRHGLCGVYGQHWGGPEGDAFGRAVRRFEELGVGAAAARLHPARPPRRDALPPARLHRPAARRAPQPRLPHERGLARRRRRRARRVRPHGRALARGGRTADRRLLRRRARADRRRARGAGRQASGRSAPRRRGAPRARRRPCGAARAVGRCGRALPVPARLPRPRHPGRRLRPVAGLVPDLAPPVPRAASAAAGAAWTSAAAPACRPSSSRSTAPSTSTPSTSTPTPPRPRGSTRFATAWRTASAPAAVDLFAWRPEARYDVIVASLFQTPVDPFVPAHTHRPAGLLGPQRGRPPHPRSCPRRWPTTAWPTSFRSRCSPRSARPPLVHRRGLQARVVDFAFLPITDNFRQQRRAHRAGRADVRRASPRGLRRRRAGRLPPGDRSQALTRPAREKG